MHSLWPWSGTDSRSPDSDGLMLFKPFKAAVNELPFAGELDHYRARRPLAHPFKHAVDLIGRPLDHGFDRAVVQIAHPAAYADHMRMAHRRPAIADTLHAAFDVNMVSFYGTVVECTGHDGCGEEQRLILAISCSGCGTAHALTHPRMREALAVEPDEAAAC